MKKQLLFLLIVGLGSFFLADHAAAQAKMGNNLTTINAGAVLELESPSKGFLMPRISLASTTVWGLDGTATEGMTVYNTNATITSGSTSYPSNGVGEYYWDGTGWVAKHSAAVASGFSQSYTGTNLSVGAQNTWFDCVNQTVTAPRDGKYLIMAKAELAMGSVVNASDNAFSKGALRLVVDGTNIDDSNFSATILWPNPGIGLNTTAPLQGVVFLTKGNHTVQVQAIGFTLYNQTLWNFTNAKLTVALTGE